MKKKEYTPKLEIKKLKLNKKIISNFDTKKIKGGSMRGGCGVGSAYYGPCAGGG